MNNNLEQSIQNDIKENMLAGIVGAFLFSLVGGALWFILYLVGFIAGISGLVGAGRSELVEGIFGMHRLSSGEVSVKERKE